MAKKFLTDKGIQEKDVTVCGVGIDTQVLSNRNGAKEQALYQDMMAHADDLKLLYIGRLEERRNIPFILNVFKLVREKESTARLYIIGTGDQDYVDQVWKLAEDLKIKNAIVWQEADHRQPHRSVYGCRVCVPGH